MTETRGRPLDGGRSRLPNLSNNSRGNRQQQNVGRLLGGKGNAREGKDGRDLEGPITTSTRRRAPAPASPSPLPALSFSLERMMNSSSTGTPTLESYSLPNTARTSLYSRATSRGGIGVPQTSRSIASSSSQQRLSRAGIHNPDQQFAPSPSAEEKSKSFFFLTQRAIPTPPSGIISRGGTANSVSRPSTRGEKIPLPPPLGGHHHYTNSQRDSPARSPPPRSTPREFGLIQNNSYSAYIWDGVDKVPALFPAPAQLPDEEPPRGRPHGAGCNTVEPHVGGDVSADLATSPRFDVNRCDDILYGANRYVAEATEEFEEALASSEREQSDEPRKRIEKDARNNVLVKALFQLKLSNESTVKRKIKSMQVEEVKRVFLLVSHRYGLRQMTPDDFHTVLCEILDDDGLPYSETKLLFELFDSNRSGLVDADEFVDGLRLLDLDDRTMILTYCRKIFTETRNFRDTVLSASEIRQLLDTTVSYYDEDPVLRAESEVVMSFVWKNAHHGQILVPSLRGFVHTNARHLKDAFFRIKPNTNLAPQEERYSPEPFAVFEELAHGSSSGSIAGSALKKRNSGSGEKDAKRKITATIKTAKVANDQHGLMTPRSEQQRAWSQRRSTAVHKALLKSPQVSPLAPSLGTPVDEPMDFYHPLFRGDLHRVDDVKRQLGAPEPGNPRWYVSRDQLWKVEEGMAPMPMLDIL